MYSYTDTDISKQGKYIQNLVKDWFENLNKVDEYISKNKCFPNKKDNRKLFFWQNLQKKNFLKKRGIVTFSICAEAWKHFINNNKNLFESLILKSNCQNENDPNNICGYKYFYKKKENWLSGLSEIKIFINKNKRLPKKGIDSEKKLYYWLYTQKKNHKSHNKGLLKNSWAKPLWLDFMKEYSIFFKTQEHKDWRTRFFQVKEFIRKNKRLPKNVKHKKEEYLLYIWLQHQRKNFRNNEGTIVLEENKKLWNGFINFLNKNNFSELYDYDLSEDDLSEDDLSEDDLSEEDLYEDENKNQSQNNLFIMNDLEDIYSNSWDDILLLDDNELDEELCNNEEFQIKKQRTV